MEGRLHVHLRELKDQLQERHPHYGELASITRELVSAYVQERLMILSEEILAVIDRGDFNEAVDLMLPGLQKLREQRLQVSNKATATRSKKKEDAGKKKAGIKTKEEKLVKDMYQQLMGGFE
jgi:hypothetical protein